MAKSTRGFCKYCGKEYTRTGIAKHLQTCKKRVDSCEKAEKTEKYFEYEQPVELVTNIEG